METLEYSTLVLSWIGLICFTALAGGLLYIAAYWILWNAIKRLPFKSLFNAFIIAVQLSAAGDKPLLLAHIVAHRLDEAEKANPLFGQALRRLRSETA